jgi:hypothetical protein
MSMLYAVECRFFKKLSKWIKNQRLATNAICGAERSLGLGDTCQGSNASRCCAGANSCIKIDAAEAFKCQPLGLEGAQCFGTSFCKGNRYCATAYGFRVGQDLGDISSIEGKCETLLAPGANCKGSGRSNHKCSGSENHCVNVATGAYKCQPKGGEGDQCFRGNSCLGGLYCANRDIHKTEHVSKPEGGTCTPFLAPGETCGGGWLV